ncbi:MAG: hypothetical protein ACRD0P_09790, partial [Stackebrandtia sp.]
MSNDTIAGDLNDLRLAAEGLGTVANDYWSMAYQMTNRVSSNEEKYGRAHEWWSYVADQLCIALRTSYSRLCDGQTALSGAIDAYAYVDGDNAKELTDIGKKYKEYVSNLDDADMEIPLWKKDALDEYDPPDLDDKPDGWDKNH